MAAARRAGPSILSDPSLRVVSAPIDWVLTCQEVEDWMKQARCGERLRYGQGRQLVRGATSALMRRLADAGDVHLFQPRSASGDGFDFLAVRNRIKVEVQHKAPRIQAGPALDPNSSALLLKLKTVARLGDVCPSDKQLGLALGLTRDQVKWSLKKLVTADLVATRIEPTARHPKFRVVRIIASGRETKGPAL